MLLYIHVPFCVRKCAYCAFHSVAYTPETMERCVQLIVQDMRARAGQSGGKKARTLYFGGGTPSLLASEQVETLLDAAARFYGLDAAAEITLEANPESVTRPGFLQSIRALGVNRLSLGVQSLHDRTLQILGRPHDALQARQAVRAARQSGFENLSLDLIWGVPGQTPALWLKDLAAAADLEPDHLSCYGLSLEEGAPLAQAVEGGTLVLPGEEDGADMYVRGGQYLAGRGFLQYEVSNFARPGKESLHNQGYWNGGDYLGFGPSAVSTVGQRRFTAPRDLQQYAAFVAGAMDAEEEFLSADTVRREQIMLALRTTSGLDLNMLPQSAAAELREALKPLRLRGQIRLEDGRLSLTRTGMLVSNSIIEFVLDLMDGPHGNTGTV